MNIDSPRGFDQEGRRGSVIVMHRTQSHHSKSAADTSTVTATITEQTASSLKQTLSFPRTSRRVEFVEKQGTVLSEKEPTDKKR